jgi:DNA (cytosine-5)-methyltransferase 1
VSNSRLHTIRHSKLERLTVLDLFCGAGGFSEGFRSVGFQIVNGVDHWRPAVETFNCNFGLRCRPSNVLQFENNPDLIDKLPDTDVIIGSPPCVSFSYSNKLGNADKAEGLRLIKIFFAIVAVKKFKQQSKLVAWYMENVTNALDSIPSAYTFSDLGLGSWARQRQRSPSSIAIRITENATVLNAADFGVPQMRKRLFVYEIVTHDGKTRELQPLRKRTMHVACRTVRSRLPRANCVKNSRRIRDPFRKSIRIPLSHLTDHFYETGAYQIHWRDSRLLKISHPYMGRMSFPEKETKPSRTIVANPFPRSREALLYKSEWKRIGNGEYRGPTIREAATLMSFPITYQFIGSEGAKWKLVGNAVCPLVARKLAIQLLRSLRRKIRNLPRSRLPLPTRNLPNLNTFAPKSYDNPPRRRRLARFRSHPFKAASMTVALANYDVTKKNHKDGQWRCFVTYGIGEGYIVQRFRLNQLARIRRAVESASPDGPHFVEHIMNGFSSRIPSARVLQELYEDNLSARGRLLHPNALLEEARKIVFRYADSKERIVPNGLFRRNNVPKSQLYALFAVCQIAAIAKTKSRPL